MKKIILLLNLILIGCFLGLQIGCSGGEKPNVELIQDMMETPAVKAQEKDELAPAKRGMRVPPEHTIPVGYKPYKFANDGKSLNEFNFDEMVKTPNPIAGQMTEEILLQGQKNYAIHCALCHGEKGKGDGYFIDKMPRKPPALVGEISNAVKWTDGQIHHVIFAGQGLMGPYSSHLSKPEERWSVVNYIRHLQKEAR